MGNKVLLDVWIYTKLTIFEYIHIHKHKHSYNTKLEDLIIFNNMKEARNIIVTFLSKMQKWIEKLNKQNLSKQMNPNN